MPGNRSAGSAVRCREVKTWSIAGMMPVRWPGAALVVDAGAVGDQAGAMDGAEPQVNGTLVTSVACAGRGYSSDHRRVLGTGLALAAFGRLKTVVC